MKIKFTKDAISYIENLDAAFCEKYNGNLIAVCNSDFYRCSFFSFEDGKYKIARWAASNREPFKGIPLKGMADFIGESMFTSYDEAKIQWNLCCCEELFYYNS